MHTLKSKFWEVGKLRFWFEVKEDLVVWHFSLFVLFIIQNSHHSLFTKHLGSQATTLIFMRKTKKCELNVLRLFARRVLPKASLKKTGFLLNYINIKEQWYVIYILVPQCCGNSNIGHTLPVANKLLMQSITVGK